MMRKIHLISISDPLIYELAVAIRDRGYEVSVSGEHVPEEIDDEAWADITSRMSF